MGIIETQIFKVDYQNPNPKDIAIAAQIIKDGGLVAFPTETVYGLGADATNPNASKEIYRAKGRPGDNPLIVHIDSMDMLWKVADQRDYRAERLADRFWGGPLTIILKKSELIPKETTGGLDTVAVRMPGRIVAQRLISAAGVPIAAPSANISGRPSPTMAKHVIEDFTGRIQGIIDDGPSPIGLESTIVDLSESETRILRPGYITLQDVEDTLDERVYIGYGNVSTERPKAPGMKYKHYAPKGELVLVKGDISNVVRTINELLDIAKGKREAVISCDENISKYNTKNKYSLGSMFSEDIMRNLYRTLRLLDEDRVDIAYCETFYNLKHSEAIMERLKRASSKIIEV